MRAFVVSEVDDTFTSGLRDVEAVRVESSDVLVAVNFKDAMVAAPKSRVRRVPTLVGGVDAAGTIVDSRDDSLPVGTRVAVHGGALGVARDGGFASFVYSPVRYVSALPDSPRWRVCWPSRTTVSKRDPTSWSPGRPGVSVLRPWPSWPRPATAPSRRPVHRTNRPG